jgi:hypothetical protein
MRSPSACPGRTGGPALLLLLNAALLAFGGLLSSGCRSGEIANAQRSSPEQRAVAFLAREVPAWSRENGCFSCHNNGDAARALYAAKRAGFKVPSQALADTTAWVSQPDRWDDNQGDPGFSDQRLANVQFAASLLAAMDAGQVEDVKALRKAALRVAGEQAADGAWPVGAPGSLGSPATHGTPLTTYVATRVLRRVDSPEARRGVERGEAWLRQAPLTSVLDGAVALLAFHNAEDVKAVARRETAGALLRRAQTSDGGWGPYPDTPAEVFDTAVVLLALAANRHLPGADAAITRGRRFLILTQQADGGWPATTRPARGDSYAQRISTTGWATLALLETQGP